MVSNDDSWNDFFRTISQQLPHIRKFLLYSNWDAGNRASWSICHISDGRSSLKTQAVGKYLRKGGGPPETDKKYRKHILNLQTVERSIRRSSSALRSGRAGLRRIVVEPAYTEYIDDPNTDIECSSDDDEDEDLKFWKAHL